VRRTSIIVAAGCLTALILGLVLAYPLLVTNTPVTLKNGLDVKVVYAYFGTPSFDPNITGLYQNYTSSQQFVTNNNEGQIIGDTVYNTHAVSYFIVLNITNLSNMQASLFDIRTLVGPSITESDFFGGAVAASNPILNDYRQLSPSSGWNNMWIVNDSRLIYLSGIIGALNSTYSSLNSNIWIYAQVHGSSYENGNVAINGVDYKQMPFQTFGEDHLYNNLVGENQTLIFLNEFDVSLGRPLQ